MRYTEQSSGSSHIVRYIYDKINNLTSTVEIINGVPHQTSYAYDNDNRITSTTVGDLSRSYDYDAFGRLIVKDTKKSGTSVLYQRQFYRKPTTGTTTNQVGSIKYTYGGTSETHTYTYDKNGNILSVNNGTSTTSYVYDSQNQLIRENNQAANKTWVWAYDNAGNITSRKEYAYTTGTLGTAVDTVPYTYGDTTWRDLMTTYDGNWIHYDGVGNPDTDGTWDYTWRNGRELASMTNGSTTWTFTYNADGIRTQKTDGTTVYKYTYNGDTLTQLDVGVNRLFFVYDGASPTAVVYNGTTYYYQTNLQGDIIALLNSSGTKVVEYTYDAWGNILSTTGSMASTLGVLNPLRYRGYVYDSETGLYYLQSRYYNPAMGRFINADAFPSTGQGLLGNNMFAYCLNNPANLEDFSGTYSYNGFTGERRNGRRKDCPHDNNYIPYTVSMGGIIGVGIGPLSVSLQIALVTDSAGDSEIQISYSSPNIFSTGLPSVDEMLADITADSPKFKFGATIAGTFTFTNAPSVYNLYGPTYSVGGALPGIAVDYNTIPVGDGSNEVYSGVSFASGMITPGVNVSMSNTVFGIPVPFSVFDISEAMYEGIYGR